MAPTKKMSAEFRRLGEELLDAAASTPHRPRLREAVARKVRRDLAKLQEHGDEKAQAFAVRMLTLYPSLQGAAGSR
jgi:hypothetical protein